MWTKWHTLGVVADVVLILGLGIISAYVTFGQNVNWGVWAFLTMVGLLLALLVVIGHGITGRIGGVLMDSRARLSLSQFQLAVWTLVVLSGWSAAVFANFGANKGIDAFNVNVPTELWLALGISLTTLGGAKLVQATSSGPLQTIADDTPEAQALAARGANPADWRIAGSLLARADGEKAGWGDLFGADSADSGATPDISKIQMFFFTIVLAFGYSIACADLFATNGNMLISQLPPINESFVILLGISQGGYFIKKTVDLKA